MAMSATSFNSASMVAKLKLAMHEAAYGGTGTASVFTRKGKHLLTVSYNHRGSVPFNVYHNSSDVTALAMQGARMYHSNQGAQ